MRFTRHWQHSGAMVVAVATVVLLVTWGLASAAGSRGTAAPGAYQGRCGYGPRLPLLVISPFAKVNFVDHSVTDQSSILRFIEDNWELGRLGDQSFDEQAGSLLNMFNFSGHHRAARLFLDPATGQVLKP